MPWGWVMQKPVRAIILDEYGDVEEEKDLPKPVPTLFRLAVEPPWADLNAKEPSPFAPYYVKAIEYALVHEEDAWDENVRLVIYKPVKERK